MNTTTLNACSGIHVGLPI